MKLHLSRYFPFLACVFSFACHPGNKDGRDPDSGLSSVNIGNFVPGEGMTAWTLGKLAMTDSTSKKAIIEKSFSAAESQAGTGGSPDVKVPLGDYIVQLQYFSDGEAKTLIYKSCLDDKDQEIVQSVRAKKVALKVEICRVKDDNPVGTTTGDESDVTIDPIIRKPDAVDPAATPNGAVSFTDKP